MIGSRIGPYAIVSELGSGGMGKVYLAKVAGHAPGLDDGVKVALKVIHPLRAVELDVRRARAR